MAEPDRCGKDDRVVLIEVRAVKREINAPDRNLVPRQPRHEPVGKFEDQHMPKPLNLCRALWFQGQHQCAFGILQIKLIVIQQQIPEGRKPVECRRKRSCLSDSR